MQYYILIDTYCQLLISSTIQRIKSFTLFHLLIHCMYIYIYIYVIFIFDIYFLNQINKKLIKLYIKK